MKSLDFTMRSLRRKPKETGQLGILLEGKWLKLPQAMEVVLYKKPETITMATLIRGKQLVYLSLEAKHSRVYEVKGEELVPVSPEREQEIYQDFSSTIEKQDTKAGNLDELARLAEANPTLLDSLPLALANQVRAKMEKS